MAAKEYLTRLRQMSIQIKQMQDKLYEMQTDAISLGGMDYSRERVQTSPAGDPPYVRSMDAMIDLEQTLSTELDRYSRMQSDAVRWIDCLPSEREREIMRLRYIEGMRWDEVSRRLGCRNRWAIRVHARALRHMDTIYRRRKT